MGSNTKLITKTRLKKLLKLLVAVYLLRIIIGSIYTYNITPSKKITSISNNEYYMYFDYVKEKSAFILDSNNVTYVDYSKIKSLGVENTLSYNPVSIGLMGLHYHQSFLKSNKKNDKKLILSHANWLVENQTKQGSWLINHDKKIDNQKLNAPWVSSLSQGFGMSLLTRAFILTNDSIYLQTALKAIEPFKKSISEDGLKSQAEFGDFYEEYPLDKPDHVLNGFIYSLYGLYDVYIHTQDSSALELFNNGVATLEKIVKKYNTGSWTYYSLNETSNIKNHWNYSSPFYQKIHYCQLHGIYLITNKDVFKKYSKKFEKQSKRGWINFLIYPSYTVYTDIVWVIRLF